MGDRVAVLKDGVLQQCDTPLALYDEPANLFVASFIGSSAMNLLEARIDSDGSADLGGYRVPLPRDFAAGSTGAVTLGVRPEGWRLTEVGEDGYPVEVAVVEELGADAFIYAVPAGGDAATAGLAHQQIVVRVDGRLGVQKGDTITLAADPDRTHVFDTASGARLSD